LNECQTKIDRTADEQERSLLLNEKQSIIAELEAIGACRDGHPINLQDARFDL
jgi:hypothetical protein